MAYSQPFQAPSPGSSFGFESRYSGGPGLSFDGSTETNTDFAAGLLNEISTLDVYADDDNLEQLDNSFPPLSELDVPEIFDADSVCTLLKDKIHQPPSTWTKRTADGLVLHLQEASSQNSTPQYVPLQIALDLVSSILLFKLGEEIQPNVENASQLHPQSMNPHTPSPERLEIYAWGMELLQILHSLGNGRDKLLPNLPLLRFNLQHLVMRVIIESVFWFADTYSQSSTTHNNQEVSHAIKACFHAFQIYNQILSEELKGFTKHGYKFEQASRCSDQKYSYPFLWFNSIANGVNAAYYVPLLLQFTHCIINEPFPASGKLDKSDTSNLWNCFYSLLTFFFYICFSNQTVGLLLSNSDFKTIFNSFDTLLKRVQKNHSDFAFEIKYYILRIVTVLAETDNPYFLDHFHEMESNGGIISVVINEAAKISQILTLASTEDTEQYHFLVVKEAFRILLLFSMDSNYVALVTDNCTLFLMEMFSVDSPQFVSCLSNAYQQSIGLLIFKMLAYLNCYNPQFSPLENKGRLITHIFGHCSTLFSVENGIQLTQTKRIVVQNVLANLYYLYHWIPHLFEISSHEHNLFVNLLSSIEDRFGIKYPTLSTLSDSTQMLPTPPRRGRASLSGSTRGQEASQTEIEDDETVIEGLGPRTKSLKGISVSFGKVPDINHLKTLIKYHGGNVLEYVSKSVTHVVCAPDSGSLQASTSKIQSAASKQIPAVSDKFIYESIEAGHVLPEKNYLVSAHAFQRRFQR